MEKEFNEAVKEYVGFYGNPYQTLTNILEKEETHIMANIMKLSFELLGNGIKLQKINKNYQKIKEKIKNELNQIQELYCKAIEYQIKGQRKETVKVYEEILSSNPKELLALKLCQEQYFYLGDFQVFLINK
jgi:tetratricopeptide (TPR) repeat protein